MPTDDPVPGKPLPEEHDSQLAEFMALQEKQWKALDLAVYVGMTPSEAKEYERRAQRINELQGILGADLTPHKDRMKNPRAGIA